MPYNLEVLATYRGRLGAESMLPSSGNALATCGLPGIRLGSGFGLQVHLKQTGSIRKREAPKSLNELL